MQLTKPWKWDLSTAPHLGVGSLCFSFMKTQVLFSKFDSTRHPGEIAVRPMVTILQDLDSDREWVRSSISLTVISQFWVFLFDLCEVWHIIDEASFLHSNMGELRSLSHHLRVVWKLVQLTRPLKWDLSKASYLYFSPLFLRYCDPMNFWMLVLGF